MQLKHYDKPGYLAWSNSKNHSQLLATASFTDTNGFYTLDILQIDLQERSKKINVVGSGYTDTPFRCIAWDNFGQKQNTYTNGLIFSGMEDGSFLLWNPQTMIATYQPQAILSAEGLEVQTCMIYKEEPEQDQFPIMCAQWNNLKNNFLAFGGTDVLLLNVGKNPTDPQISKPGKKNPHAKSYVTSVSWNRQVPHILASASENGLVALWDIKTNNSIFQFKDSGISSGQRNVSICWSKSISTQIAVTLDDQKRNQLQIWDLRNQKGPVVVIDRVHTKGINSMDWCETDPELILTASRDNRLACWNYTQEDAPLSQNHIDGGVFTVKWAKKLPSIYAVSNEEKTSVYTLSDNMFGYVPKWYKVPVGSTMLGSDAALTYSEQRGAVLHQSKITRKNKNPELKEQLKSLHNVLEGTFDQKSNDSEISNLIKAKNSNQADSGIFDYLGLNKEQIVKQVEKYTGKRRQFAIGPQKTYKDKVTKPKQKVYTQIQGTDAHDFFAKIGNTSFEPAKQQQDDNNNQGQIQYDMVPRNFNWDKGKQRLVKQNILIGNYQGAIDAALKCGRTAQALIIAYSVDQNLFSTTLKTFFTQTTDNFITDVLKCIAYRDPVELINKYQLDKWKQCVALIYSMSSGDKRAELLKLLAQRLRQEQNQNGTDILSGVINEAYPPVICYILAQDFDKIAQIYFQSLNTFRSGSLPRKQTVLQYTRRLVQINQGLTVQISDCKQFNRMLKQSMFVAIEQGMNIVAHSLCTRIPNNMKMIDYLVSNTKELEKYRGSVQYKPVLLPVMQIKKNTNTSVGQKNTTGPSGTTNKGQKKGIFPHKEEEQSRSHIAPPPPPVPKRKDEESYGGFSPYDTSKPTSEKPTPPPTKKNLNTPPPPPPSQPKKGVSHIQNQPLAEQQSEQDRSVIHKAPIQPPPPHKKTQPPPPPPPTHSHVQQQDDQSVSSGKRPPPPPASRNNPPPPPAHLSDKKPPPQVIQQPKQIHSPPVSQYHQEEPEEKSQPPPPPKKRMPPPPSPSNTRQISEPDHMHSRQEVTPPPSSGPRRGPPPPPPTREEPQKPKKQMNLTPPPAKIEQKQVSEQSFDEGPKRPLPVPPPGKAKKGPPPPPPKR